MITLDVNLLGALLSILSAVLTAFVAVSRYTSNLRLSIQELSYENTLLRKDAGSAIRQLRHAKEVQDQRIEDLEEKLKAETGFQPHRPIAYTTDAPWLNESRPDSKRS